MYLPYLTARFFRCDQLPAAQCGGSIKAPPQSEDQELVHRSQTGDTQAFGELVTKYRAKILTMLYVMVRNENDAGDLAQEGFLRAWRAIGQFKGRSTFYTWLYGLTMNLAIDALRRRDRREEVELDDAIPSSLPIPVSIINAERFGSTSVPLWQSFLQNIEQQSF
jgi:RNA polymerase sigma factor (sigma-70 family)